MVMVQRMNHLTASEARQIADLHKRVIREGFLTHLGIPFLTQMYRAFAVDPGVCLIVAQHGDRIAGFTCTAIDLPQTYRRFMLKRGVAAAAAAARTLLKPASLRRVIETLRAARVGDNTKVAEAQDRQPVLMNLCVDPAEQRKGLGRMMMKETALWLAENAKEVLVAVTGESQRPAVEFYRHLGAIEQGTSNVHGDGRSHRFIIRVATLLDAQS